MPTGGRQTNWLFTSMNVEQIQGLLRNNSSLMVEAGLEPAISGFQAQRPNHSATLPCSSDTRRLSRLKLLFVLQYLQQSPDLQSTFWVLCPTQSLPSFEGGGLSQDLTRILTPTPQDLVQALQDDHSPQFPSTKIETKKKAGEYFYREVFVSVEIVFMHKTFHLYFLW